jgi:hypothetical protein
MTSSSSPPSERGLDTMILVFSLLQGHPANLPCEDQGLARACTQLGINPISPLDAVLRQQVAAWEVANLAPKGMPRILRRVHDWLSQAHPQASTDFWSKTSGGNRLP